MATWNINGWTRLNGKLRTEIILQCNYDIYCLCETHLRNNDTFTINVDNYQWFPHNRELIHRNARKGSGGVGVLVKKSFLNSYDIKCIDRCFDGVIKLKIYGKFSKCIIVIFCCYLTPENSTRGRVSHDFFACLSSQIYLNVENSDVIMLCGDFNARIGHLSDCINGLDDVSNRKVLG